VRHDQAFKPFPPPHQISPGEGKYPPPYFHRGGGITYLTMKRNFPLGNSW